MEEPKGLIFDIQGHSIHDGPGTRTVVFLSGCPLRCTWCANPEGQLLRPRLMYKAQFCMKCPVRCTEACPRGAVRPSVGGGVPVRFDRTVCDSCDEMDCTKVCYMQALQVSGKWHTVDEVMRIFNRDRCYWASEGGITLSGGEPLMQEAFALKLLERCQEAYIDTCVETSAYVSRRSLQSVLPFVQWLFVDIKHMDSLKHLEATGVPNESILDNIRWLATSAWAGRIVIRVPIVPGYNDTIANAQATADFLSQVGLEEINLLPFHKFGGSKYEYLGLPDEHQNWPTHDSTTLQPLADVYRKHGMKCHLGSDTPF